MAKRFNSRKPCDSTPVELKADALALMPTALYQLPRTTIPLASAGLMGNEVAALDGYHRVSDEIREFVRDKIPATLDESGRLS